MKLYFSRTEQYVVAILLLAILGALLVFCYSAGRRERASRRAPEAFYVPAKSPVEGTPAYSPVESSIAVHIAGAVQQPGVYTFEPGQRTIDAITRAGGARSDAYPDALNLAAKLEDGSKIYVPTKAEWQKLAAEIPPPLVQQSKGSEASVATITRNTKPPARSTTDFNQPKPLPKGTIALNTAGKEQLMTLPGIGEVTAQHILDYRAAHGKFTDIAQLLEIERIGPKTLEKLKPYLTL